MDNNILSFERPIFELEAKLGELESASEGHADIDVSKEIERMGEKVSEMRKKIYGNLSAWEKVQIARHPNRPSTRDFIGRMTHDFVELHGDRLYRDDRAIIGGFARLDNHRIMLIGTQKGRDTKSRIECNFGYPQPEGYHKALRLMKLANKFGIPIVTLIDTPGASAGVESEERHVAKAIAVNLRESFTFTVPMIAVITGEGGSGGALGISIADRILILENAYYSVITPEGCAAILWKDKAYASQAAEALKLTAQDLLNAGLTDGIISEPLGGAHNDIDATATSLKNSILEHLNTLRMMPPDERRDLRYAKFRAMGQFEEPPPPPPPGESELQEEPPPKRRKSRGSQREFGGRDESAGEEPGQADTPRSPRLYCLRVHRPEIVIA